MGQKTLLSWSSGKDSAWALHVLRQDPEIDVVGLYSVLNKRYNRVSMHSTRTDVLKKQADAVGLPVHVIYLPDPCTLEQSHRIMGKFVAGCKADDIEFMAFGDLFLEDIRQYRENQLAGSGISAIFPVWQIPTDILAIQMLENGLEAYISCVDLKKLPASFVGRKWNQDLLKKLPPGIDPCGENGEMHTIVVNGPMFDKPVKVEVGEIVERDGYAFADIVPVK